MTDRYKPRPCGVTRISAPPRIPSAGPSALVASGRPCAALCFPRDFLLRSALSSLAISVFAFCAGASQLSAQSTTAPAVTVSLPDGGSKAARDRLRVTGKPPAANTIGVGFGLLGPGLEITRALSSRLALRLGGYSGQLVLTIHDGGEREIDVRLRGAAVLLDYLTSRNGAVALTVGGVYNTSRVRIASTPGQGEITSVNNTDYSPGEIGSLTVVVEAPEVAPYVGIRIGSRPRAGRGFGVRTDFGLAGGRLRETLSSANAGSNAQLASDIIADQRNYQTKLNKLPGLPVLGTFMLTYRF